MSEAEIPHGYVIKDDRKNGLLVLHERLSLLIEVAAVWVEWLLTAPRAGIWCPRQDIALITPHSLPPLFLPHSLESVAIYSYPKIFFMWVVSWHLTPIPVIGKIFFFASLEYPAHTVIVKVHTHTCKDQIFRLFLRLQPGLSGETVGGGCICGRSRLHFLKNPANLNKTELVSCQGPSIVPSPIYVMDVLMVVKLPVPQRTVI